MPAVAVGAGGVGGHGLLEEVLNAFVGLFSAAPNSAYLNPPAPIVHLIDDSPIADADPVNIVVELLTAHRPGLGSETPE